MARDWGTALVSWLLEELPERVWEIIIETKLVLRSGETVENTCWCDLVWDREGVKKEIWRGYGSKVFLPQSVRIRCKISIVFVFLDYFLY
jgi:hypothetical protein